MARGFESKSVEQQQEAYRLEPTVKRDPKIAEREREKQTLTMQRERILSERTSSGHRRAALQAALEEIEAKLAKM